jgi:hypothetical protein
MHHEHDSFATLLSISEKTVLSGEGMSMFSRTATRRLRAEADPMECK